MKKTPPRASALNPSLLSVAVAACFTAGLACANPTGPQVVNGAAAFQNPNASTLNVTNTPGAIINWQGFSIGAGEVTRFIQQSSSSMVLNRVVSGDVSQIYGQLLSNGRVFLINPGGILVGPGAVVDTAGFVASTLNMVDADFIAGKLRFSGDGDSGSISNQGWIRTGYGGKVVLVAPHIENSGLIHTPGGELILAAGQKLTVSSLDYEGVQFEVQAPTDSVVNIGKLLADGGAVGAFAGTLRHSGDIRANSLVYDEAGRVVLQAQGDLQLAAGSTTSASGKTGGSITLQSARGLTEVAGTVSAQGSAGKGGDIRILGETVALRGGAAINASGSAGGGLILAGGDFHGANAAVQNASRTDVEAGATLRADATASGDGGRVIVWSDGKTEFRGALSARGGPDGGNGGFAEISGKRELTFYGIADLGAPKGSLGSVLLDPIDLYVSAIGGLDPTIIDASTDYPGNAATVSGATVASITGNVTLYASRYMRISNNITLTGSGQGLTAQVGTWPDETMPLAATDPLNLSVGTVPNRLDLGANITTVNGAVSLSAPEIRTFGASTIATAGGAVTLNAAGPIYAGALTVDAGAGTVNATAGGGGMELSGISSSGGVTLTSTNGYLNIGDIASTGAVTLKSDSNLYAGVITTGGGALTANAASYLSTGDLSTAGATGGGAVTVASAGYYVNTGNISAGSGNVSVSGTSVETSTIDTTGTVALTASQGSVYSTINNASGVTASATNSQGSATVDLSSDTVLKVNSATATTTYCNSGGGCASASVSLDGKLGVNVGAVSASAPVETIYTNSYPFNNTGGTYEDPRFEYRREYVNVFSSDGPILAQSASSQITANNVSLGTGLLSGGGIGSNATPLKVDATSSLDFMPNGSFSTQLTGTGPVNLNMEIGVAPTGQSYSGTLTRTGINLNVSANDTTVTVNTLDISSGFDTRVYNTSPFIGLYVPNGNLVATTVKVPKGDQTGINSPYARYNCATYGGGYCPAQPTVESLPVDLRADKDLTVASYIRAAGTVPKTTDFSSDSGGVTLGTINANIDSVSANAATGMSIANLSAAANVSASTGSGNVTITSLTTSGNASASTGSGDVTITSLTAGGSAYASTGSGNITVGLLAATSGATLNAPSGVVQAQSDTAGIEITSGGTISINAMTIGASAFANPLDLAGGSVVLTSNGGGAIGFTGKPVVANTQDLTVNAANGSTFNVDTGTTALRDLNVTASPAAVGNGGLAQVKSESQTYAFQSDGTNFTLGPWTTPATQFNGGTLAFTSTTGDIALGALNTAGGLSILAQTGSIAAQTIDAAGAVSLIADQSTSTFTSVPVTVTTGNIGSTTAPSSLTISAGSYGYYYYGRPGAVTTGTLEAGSISINSYAGDIVTGDIGAANRAGAVTLTANNTYNWGDAGNITTGNVRADSIDARSYYYTYYNNPTITTGNLDLTSSVFLQTKSAVSTGSIDAPSVSIYNTYYGTPTVDTGAIGASRPVSDLTLYGTAVNIAGAVTGDPAAADSIRIYGSTVTLGGGVTAGASSNIDLRANGGMLAPGGDVTAGDGSTIYLSSYGATQFQFSNVSAGPTGTVTIYSPNGIEQTGATGITAQTVDLNAPNSGAQIQRFGALAPVALDLHGTSDLSVETGGGAMIDLHGSTLTDLSLSKSSGPDSGAFTLSGTAVGQSLAIGDSGSGNHTVQLTSTSPLNFNGYFNTSGVQTLGGGISTGGGSVYLDLSGPLNATTGGITTLGGSVTVYSGSTVNTGAINTSTAGNLAGGGILIGTYNSAGDITVDGNLNTGTGGGTIALNAYYGGNIARSGGSSVSSGTDVSIYTYNGDIGSSGTPLLISAPSVTLEARAQPSATGSVGHAFASLTGTSSLGLNGYNGFNVSSDTPFSALSVSTLGSGTGTPGSSTLNLSATSQTYGFARPTTDLFGNTIANTLEITQAGGATPPTDLTVHALDGDLLVRGPATISAANLSLLASTSGDIKLQGNAANPLTLNNSGQQYVGYDAGFGSARDILITGKVTLTASDQRLSAYRDITAQAQGGSISLSAADQAINSTTGTVALLGGTGADEAVTVSASASQEVRTYQYYGGLDIVLQAGTGDRASATLNYTGTGTQTVEANRDVLIHGGDGTSTGSTAAVTTATGSQLIRAEGNVVLTGGAGTNATARIANSGSGDQQIGSSNYYGGYITDNATVQGGTGSGSFAEITAAGPQRLHIANGSLDVLGGSGANAYAKIESSGTSEQQVGNPAYNCCNNIYMGALNLAGGSGTGAYAKVSAAGDQRVTASSSISLTGGGASGTSASLIGVNQDIRYGAVTVQAGAGDGANALVQSSGGQYFYVYGLNLAGGGGASATATAQVLSGTTQQFDYAGTVSLAGGAGANSFARVNAVSSQNLDFSSINLSGGAGSGSYATIDSGDTQYLSGGNVTLTGGAGTDAIARITTPKTQTIYYGALYMNGGSGAGTHALVDAGDTQQLYGNGVTMAGGTGSDSYARIDTPKDQTLYFNSGGITMTAGSAPGTYVKIDSGLSQYLYGYSAISLTAGGSGATTLANAGAIIEGQSQTIYAGSIALKGGSGTGTSTADALLRNLSGDQSIYASSTIGIEGGNQNSTAGIVNQGSGAQSITGYGGISLVSDTAAPALGSSSVVIQNPGTTAQTIVALGGGVSLDNRGAGTLEIASGGTQMVDAGYVDVITSAGATGNAKLGAAGDQWIRTSDGTASATGSLHVAAFGSGTASVESGASQLLELDYPGLMGSTLDGRLTIGDTTAAGISRVKAVDQNIFAGSIVVQSGATGSLSELKAGNDQKISTLTGGIQVLGGPGDNTLAQIDPLTQTILVNGGVDVIGGSGNNAVAQILNGTGAQTLLTTNGNIALTGGTGVGANALITSGGLQTVGASGTITLTNGVASGGGTGGTASIMPLGGAAACSTPPCLPVTSQSGGSQTFVSDTFGVDPVTNSESDLLDLVDTLLTEDETSTLTRRAPICR